MAEAIRLFSAYKNVLLSRLARTGQVDILAPKLEAVDLTVNQVLCEPNQKMQHAYFVEVGMISVVSMMNDGRSIEVGTIGSEGLMGAMLLVSTLAVPYKYFIQLPGQGYRITTEAFREEAAQNKPLRDLVHNYHIAFLTQTIADGSLQRPALHPRTLLPLDTYVARPRAGGYFPLTHEFLALMLGVRRASVSEVLRPIQDRGWITSSRGAITVLDRKALESASCECYGLITEHHNRMMN